MNKQAHHKRYPEYFIAYHAKMRMARNLFSRKAIFDRKMLKDAAVKALSFRRNGVGK